MATLISRTNSVSDTPATFSELSKQQKVPVFRNQERVRVKTMPNVDWERQKRIERLVRTRTLYTDWHRAHGRARRRYQHWKHQLQVLSNQRNELTVLQRQLRERQMMYEQIRSEIGLGHRSAAVYAYFESQAIDRAVKSTRNIILTGKTLKN